MLTSMAAEGIVVDGIALPAGLEFTEASGNEAASFWTFEFEASASSIAIGVRRGGDVREISAGATRADLDGREVWVDDLGTEIRIAYPVDGLLLEVVGRNVEVDVLLDVMADIVWLGPVRARPAPSAAGAASALEGLPLVEALRVATETGWEIRVVGLDDVERDAMFVGYRVTVEVVDGVVTRVVSSG